METVKEVLEKDLERLRTSGDDTAHGEFEKVKVVLRYIEKLESQLEVLKEIKVEVGLGDHLVVSRAGQNALQAELARLIQLEAHYAGKATSGVNLKLAVADLLTYGLYNHRSDTGEIDKEINPIIKTVIHTKNYIIQKAHPVTPAAEPMQHGSFQGSELEEEQGLVVIKRHADKAKAESFIV